ncbi:PilN domain-containing protein [Virgibacillus byunsanensis]|uniref:PilN domain-containing protein n=1 Tax=Virgibacillus byunsanensis TaxID=570945 RepID=A0ABW3LKT5_9BACI
MNTEINLLEKQPNKYIAPVVFGILFILLMVGIFAFLLIQKNNYESQIENQESKIAQINTLLMEHQEDTSSERNLKQLEQAITSLQAEKLPIVELYKRVIGLLTSPQQLIDYDFTEENELIMNASFDNLNDVADFVTRLLEQPFIDDTELTSIRNVESAYQATLTISLNNKILVEELGENE